MVDACKRRFADREWRFEVGDARALSSCRDEEFDVVLFSHCGMDYVGHEDRLQIFAELVRVLKKGGWLCFSTHNLQRADELFSPTGLLRRCLAFPRTVRLRRANEGWASLGERDHAVLNDGAFRFRASTYHVRPAAQRALLDDLQISGVRVFRPQCGSEVSRDEERRATDPWLYYLGTRT
jgi:SAM-dependent methyltransferase